MNIDANSSTKYWQSESDSRTTHYKQVGFILGMQEWVNMRKLTPI